MSGLTPAPARAHYHSIWTFSMYDSQAFVNASGTTAATWPTASMAIYVPIKVRRPVIVKKLAISNGATASGEVDLGIYNTAGTRLVSVGGSSQLGTSTEQVFDVTDTTLQPGIYYLAAVLDNTLGTVVADADAAPLCASYGVLTEASAYPLPATATFAISHTLAFYPSVAALLTTLVS